MRLSSLGIVQRAKDVLDRIEQAIANVEAGLVLITIGGCQEDDAMAAACKTSILAELRGRKASLLRDFEAWGVQVD